MPRMDSLEDHKRVLMDHYRRPRNRGDVNGMTVIRRGSNPRCGDEVEVGLNLDGGYATRVSFRGRGCSICIASASMMTEVTTGKSVEAIGVTSRALRQWFVADAEEPPKELPAPLPALAAVRAQVSRARCVLLAWDAVDDALGLR